MTRAPHQFTGSSAWLSELAAKDLFAVRLGVLKFRGFVLKKPPGPGQALADDDFKPDMAFPNQRVAPELLHHADFHRSLTGWPARTASGIINARAAC